MADLPPEQETPLVEGSGPADRSGTGPAPGGFGPVGRRRATIINLIYQNSSAALMIVRGIFLVPVFLMYIHAELYGAWLAVWNIVNWILITQGGGAHLVRQQTAHFYGRGDRAQLAETIGSGLVVMAFLSIVAALLGLSLAPFVSGWLRVGAPGDAASLSWSYALAVIAVAIGIYSGSVRGVQQGFQRHTGVGLIDIGCELAAIALTVILLYLGWGLPSIAIGMVVRELIRVVTVQSLMFLTVYKVGIRVSVSFARIRHLARLTVWTFLNYAGDVLVRNCDALFVSLLLGNKMVPVAIFSKRAWDVLQSLTVRFVFSFQPGLAHLHGSGNRQKTQNVAEQLVVAVALCVAVGATVAWACNDAFLELWVGNEFFAGMAYNVLVGIAMVFMLFLHTGSQVMLAAGNIRGSALSLLVPNAVRALLLLASLKLLGILAIPISTLAAVLLIGGPYAIRQWKSTLQLDVRALLRQFSVIASGLAIAGGIAVVARQLPLVRSWLRLACEAAVLCVTTLALVCALQPTVRTHMGRVVGATFARLRRARDRRE